jgi:amidase
VGRDPKKLRIACTHEPLLPGTQDPECKAAIEDARQLLGALGHDVLEARPPLDGARIARAFFTVYCAGVAGELRYSERITGRPARPDDVEPTTWLMGMIGRTMFSAGDLSLAIRDLQALGRDVARFQETYDVVLTPTLGKPPVPHGALGPQGWEKRAQELVARRNATPALHLPGLMDKAVARAFGFAPFTPIANVTGQPSMSVPLYWTPDGLPMGVCFTARFGDERTLFELAGQLERARPWRHRRPPVCAGNT